MHKTEKEAEESRMKFMYSYLRDITLATDAYALVLVDEIDAHMHPAWQQVLVKRLGQLFPRVQFIATTHSPLIVSNIEPAAVYHFRREVGGLIRFEQPKVAVQGLRADQILTSPLFGLASTRDSDTHAQLVRYTKLMASDTLSQSEQEELEKLARDLKRTLPSPAEREVSRVAFATIEAAMDERLRDMPIERQKQIMEEAKAIMQEVVARDEGKP
jgi:predicted ATP-binding protein involved in virulence